VEPVNADLNEASIANFECVEKFVSVRWQDREALLGDNLVVGV